MTLFDSWESIVEQVLFWASNPKPVAARRAVKHIHERLIGVEAESRAVELWAQLTGPQQAESDNSMGAQKASDPPASQSQ